MKNKQRMTTLTIRLPPADVAKLQRVASAQSTTAAGVVRKLVAGLPEPWRRTPAEGKTIDEILGVDRK